MNLSPDQPAAPKAGIVSRLTIGYHWPGVVQPPQLPCYGGRVGRAAEFLGRQASGVHGNAHLRSPRFVLIACL